jgi:hypothetical protein
MKITPDVFEAYLKCPTKCWLRAIGKTSAGNTYSEWVKAQNGSYRMNETRRLVAQSPNDEVALSPDMKNSEAAKWRLASSFLEPGFWQCLFKQTIVASMQGYRVIPDLRGHVYRTVQVPKPFSPEKLELKGLTHRSQ